MFGHVTNLLTAYHHNELSSEERRRVESHVAACARCREKLANVGQVVNLVSAGLRTHGALEAVQATRQPALKTQRWAFPTAFAALMVLSAGLYTWREMHLPSWEVDSSSGIKVLRLGHWLETESAQVTLRIQNIGEVRVEPNSKLRLLESKPQEYRMQLEEGTMHAKISAPPHLFFVNTPSAIATDLGCAYDLTVDKTGASVLHVTTGLVQLEAEGRESFVPAGWMAKTRRDLGPGTPYIDDMSAEKQAALDVIDFDRNSSARAAALQFLLDHAIDNDTVMLWHLLGRFEINERRSIYQKMLAVNDGQAPEGTTVEGIVNLDPKMMQIWQAQLSLVWTYKKY